VGKHEQRRARRSGDFFQDLPDPGEGRCFLKERFHPRFEGLSFRGIKNAGSYRSADPAGRVHAFIIPNMDISFNPSSAVER
jgi:hypothetical protein